MIFAFNRIVLSLHKLATGFVIFYEGWRFWDGKETVFRLRHNKSSAADRVKLSLREQPSNSIRALTVATVITLGVIISFGDGSPSIKKQKFILRDKAERSIKTMAKAIGESQQYRFEHISLGLVLRDMYFPSAAPRPGDRIPDFQVPTINGDCFQSSDLGDTGPALIIFGSSTCPVTDSGACGLKTLHKRFGDQIRFVIVNVREAHPGQDISQPQLFEDKVCHARALRDLHDFPFEVATDDLDGTFHQAMSPKPNSAYLVGKDGGIIFRAHWANDTNKLTQALAAVAAGKAPPDSGSGGLILPILKTLQFIPGALDRAGRGAWADMWRAVFPLAFLAWLTKLLRLEPKTELHENNC